LMTIIISSYDFIAFINTLGHMQYFVQ